ncbi:ABC transporter permease [Halorussus amylolyticus]|uniref:ABC transporter permease n=1 Tax=Halorussus amylolyticus TaxID=1126242 RepID=UPI0010465CB9|nr:ABC transporter permease subunit [Halorussus amylolyticus]
MSVIGLARKDVLDISRSRMVWGLTGVFTLFSVLGVSLFALLGVEEASAIRAAEAIAFPSILLVPLAAIVVGYMAVVGERRSGNLRLLLGFPVSRGAVVAGKVVARTVVVAGSIAVAFAVAGGVGFALYGGFSVLRYAGFALATVGLGVAFVGLAVGISASVRSRGKALALAVGAYFLLVLFWQLIAGGAYYAVTGTVPGVEVPAWYLVLERLSPSMAYQVLVESALGAPVQASIFSIRPPDAMTATAAEQLGGGPVPVSLSTSASALVLALWSVVPAAVGYWRFRASDL